MERPTGGHPAEDSDGVTDLLEDSLDRLPQVSDEVTVAGRRLRVEGLHGRRVGLARLLPEPSTSR